MSETREVAYPERIPNQRSAAAARHAPERATVWVVTNPDARNNPRVRGVKDALVEMLRDAGRALSGEP